MYVVNAMLTVKILVWFSFDFGVHCVRDGSDGQLIMKLFDRVTFSV